MMSFLSIIVLYLYLSMKKVGLLKKKEYRKVKKNIDKFPPKTEKIEAEERNKWNLVSFEFSPVKLSSVSLPRLNRSRLRRGISGILYCLSSPL